MRKPTLDEKCKACKDGDIKQLQVWEDAGKLGELGRPPFSDMDLYQRLGTIKSEINLLNQRLLRTDKGYPIEFAIGYGRLDVLKWIKDHYRVDRSIDHWAVVCAIATDQAKVLNWLVLELGLSIDINFETKYVVTLGAGLSADDTGCNTGISTDSLLDSAIENALKTGKHSVIRWLLPEWEKVLNRNEFDRKLGDVFLTAIEYGHLDLVRWIAGSGGFDHVLWLCGIDAIRSAANCGYLEILEWIILYSGNAGVYAEAEIKNAYLYTGKGSRISAFLEPIYELLEANFSLEKIQLHPKILQVLRDQGLTVDGICRLTEDELKDLQNQSRGLTKTKL